MAAATVIIDMLDGAASLRETVHETDIIRVAIVQGLDNTILDAHEIQARALSAAGMPELGDFHPTVTHILCTEREVEVMGNDPTKARVFLTYGVPDFRPDINTAPRIRVGSVVQSVTTSQDINGNPIDLFHKVQVRKVTSGDLVWEDPPNNTIPKLREIRDTAVIEVLRPMMTFDLERLEAGSPANIARRFVGTFNGTSWAGYRAGLILCLGILGDSDDGGQTFITSYAFQYNPQGWFANVIIKDHVTGKIAEKVPSKPTPLVDPRTGLVNPPAAHMAVQVYRRKNFHDLGLLRQDGGVAIPPAGHLP